MHPAIELDGAGKTFGAVRAVENLTLRVPRGELFGFLGPNGAGKTTTIRMLCGLLRPTAGRVRVAGFDPIADGPAARSRIAYIPDTPFLYDRLTAAEFFEFVGRLHRIPARRIASERERLLALFQLDDAADTLIQEFSHGMRQRLIYAATFLRDPEIYFVDEPFTGLDPRAIRLIQNLLRERVRAGATVFLTTHLLALVEPFADRVGILRGGRLVACGALAELRARYGADRRLEDVFFDLTESAP